MFNNLLCFILSWKSIAAWFKRACLCFLIPWMPLFLNFPRCCQPAGGLLRLPFLFQFRELSWLTRETIEGSWPVAPVLAEVARNFIRFARNFYSSDRKGKRQGKMYAKGENKPISWENSSILRFDYLDIRWKKRNWIREPFRMIILAYSFLLMKLIRCLTGNSYFRIRQNIILSKILYQT